MRSSKEQSLDKKILAAVKKLSPSLKAVRMAKLLLEDSEIQAMQDYANTVSIKRLGYNDHGPVHMRTVALNTLRMMELLRRADIKTSLELEESGDFEDSLVAVLMAGFLHDVGMTMGRQEHEIHGSYLAAPIIERLLKKGYPDKLPLRVSIRSVALEAISGHMGNRVIHSLEAGVILVADGCDMEKGRARIPMAMASGPRVGDIHKYSAASIEEVRISEGKEKPIRIDVSMSGEVGLFQVEEVLLGKIAASTIKGYIELYAEEKDKEPKRYL
ncbi:MAG: HD domain-containing protein [Spirochaetaceae bacterium]|jgi:metal-dependent HD superfamily phosphatase/phosphodiesterase|nr:HD domain-containing protein [Spirochaetaceae bacterium]